MENKGNQKSAPEGGNSAWDEMAEFQKYVDFVNKKRAEQAKKEKSNAEEIEEEQAKETEQKLAEEQEFEENHEREIGKLKEELYRNTQELMEMERKQAEAELYKVVQEQMALAETKNEFSEKSAEELYRNIQEQMDLKEQTPLTAINLDWTHDKKELAHDLAERALNAEVAEAGLIKRLWKGTLFKKYYEQKYTNEYLKNQRTDEDGRTVRDIIKAESPDVMERFVLGATEDMRYIHQEIGKRNKDGSFDGEKLIPADEQTNEEIKQAIVDYARKTLEPGQKVEDLDREFQNNTRRILAMAIKDGRISEGTKQTNFLETAKKAAERYEKVAINAKNKAMQDEAMAEVMAGFQVYNAEVRNNVRTEAHRDNIDKIVNAIESSKIGRFIPAEILAGAAGIASGLTQTGVRAIAGAAGGIIASSMISGLKERNRITEDRARMLRDVANGMDYDGLGEDSRNKKTAKYEKRIGGTLYDMRKATDLINQIKEASASTSGTKSYDVLRAIAEARVRIDFSDSAQKDLISYSSADKRGKERLDLDIAVIRAEKILSEGDKKLLEGLKKEIKEQIVEGYEDEAGEYHAGVKDQDKDFKDFRAISAVKKAGKTLALGSIIFLGSQEVMAMVDPTKVGIFEKAGLVKTENNVEASDTLLAKGYEYFKGPTPTAPEATTVEYVETVTTAPRSDIHNNISDPEEVKYYESNGYTKIETSPAVSETTTSIEKIDPSASTARVDVKYDGWASNSNAIRTRLENGKFTSSIEGTSSVNGRALEFNTSNLRGYVTVGGAKFEVAPSLVDGQYVWSENGVFTTTTGETIKAIGDNGEKLYKYFELAADNGVDTNGVQHIIPLATDVGKNTFSDKLEQVIETVNEQPAVYTFIKDIPGSSYNVIRETTATADLGNLSSGITFNGLGFAPETARTGLGRASIASEAPTPEASIPEVPTPEAEAPKTPVSEVPAPEAPSMEKPAETSVETPVTPEEPAEAPVAPETPPEPTLETPVETPRVSVEIPEPEEETPAPEEEGPLILRDVPESLRNFATNYEQAVLDNRAIIGDDLAGDLLSSNPEMTPERQEKWGESINNLSEEAKATLRRILDMRNNLPDDEKYQINFGNALNNFLAMTPSILQ